MNKPISPQLQELFQYINNTPELLSLLYDMDLLPEQLSFPSREGNIMIMLTAWHRNKYGAVILGNEGT